MMLVHLMLACSGPQGDGVVPDANADSATNTGQTGDTGSTGPRVVGLMSTMGAVATLSDPPAGGFHHHATLARGTADDYLVTWTSGFDPMTHTWAQRFGADDAAIGQPAQLSDAHPSGQKPDVVRVGDGWLTAYDDRQGGIWLRPLSAAGVPSAPSSLLYQATDIDADAVDLAVQPDGSGIAIWSEFGAAWMAPDDGRITWRAFGSDRTADGPERYAEESSKKAADAAPLDDGGFVAVWARHYDHPTLPNEVLYEVQGRVYRGDGSTRSFRGDDLFDAWPSRPAVDVGADGRLAVSWRDKTSSGGDSAGAYGRLFDSDGVPLGDSIALHPGGDGDRVVVSWAGDFAVFTWQESDSQGLAGVWMSAVHADSGEIALDRLEVSETGGLNDERPSIDIREVYGGHEVLVIWETVVPGGSSGDGLRARRVTLEPVL